MFLHETVLYKTETNRAQAKGRMETPRLSNPAGSPVEP